MPVKKKSENEQEQQDKIEKRPVPAKWTIMVYMAGDNNLSEDMITALTGMMSFAGRLKNINLIALYDSNYPSVPVKVYNFSKPPEPPKSGSETRRQLKHFEENLIQPTRPTDPRRESFKIKDFVPKVLRYFPAKKYALILSGHSDGIIGKTLLRDENPSIILDLKKLNQILKDVRPFDPATGKLKNFELLGFDGCLMNMIEVGYELKDVADVLVASEGNIPTSGWAYEKVLSYLVEKEGKINEKEFAISIVKEYADFNLDYAISGRSINISACNLNSARPLSRAIYRFAQHLYDLLNLLTVEEDKNPDPSDDIKNKKIIREHFIDCVILSHYKSQTFMHNQAIDILDFIYNLLLQSIKKLLETSYLYDKKLSKPVAKQILKQTEKILNDYLAIYHALHDDENKYILASCCVGAEYQFSDGTSIFFPWTDIALEMIFNKYGSLSFNKRRRIWLRLIEKYVDLTLRKKDKNLLKNTFLNERKSKSIDLILSLSYISLAHREHGGKEHGGKEHGGKGDMDDFYRYFSQIRNYDPEGFEGDCN